jgi:hypothetical protein
MYNGLGLYNLMRCVTFSSLYFGHCILHPLSCILSYNSSTYVDIFHVLIYIVIGILYLESAVLMSVCRENLLSSHPVFSSACSIECLDCSIIYTLEKVYLDSMTLLLCEVIGYLKEMCYFYISIVVFSFAK